MSVRVITLALALAATNGLAAPPQTNDSGLLRPATDRQGEVQIESGLAQPLGDLAAGYAHTRRGMGAELGYYLGLRLRFYPERYLMVTPSFAYVEFGDHDGVDAGGDPFLIKAAVLRYGLDVCYLAPAGAGPVRPFVGAGLAIARNKYREEFPEAATEYRASVGALIGSLVAGVRAGDWECALQYDFNRFTSSRFFFAAEPLSYRWHSLLLRVGYTLPRI
jgi:hypothetical protein